MSPIDSRRTRDKNIVQRRARQRQPLPQGEITIRPPKQLPEPPAKPNWFSLLPMVVASLSTGVIGYAVSGGRAVYTAIPMLLMGLMMAGGQILYYRSQLKGHAAKVERLNTTYQAQLQRAHHDLEQGVAQQRRVMIGENPALPELLRCVAGRHEALWERQPHHTDFLSLRLGTGKLPNCLKVKVPDADDDDPRLKQAAQLAAGFADIEGLPITTNVKRLGSISLKGQKSLYLAFTLVANLVVHHSPDELFLYVLSHRPDAAERWRWVRWLPHSNALHGDGSAPRLSFSPEMDEPVLSGLAHLLRQRADEHKQPMKAQGAQGATLPHVVIVFDSVPKLFNHPVMNALLEHGPENDTNALQASAIFVESPLPPQVNGVITLRGEEVDYWESWTADAGKLLLQKGRAEWADPQQMEQLARAMAPLRTEVSVSAGRGALPTSVRLVELMDAGQPDEIDLDHLYNKPYDATTVMAFPVGLNTDLKSQVVVLREAGKGGYGSHMMLAGTTGTGKSVMLQSIVLSMALTHSPLHLNFVLADFKGGASELAKLRRLPHVVGFVTDLNPALVERFRIAIEAEVLWRKNLFDSSKERLGHPATDIYAYNKLCPDRPLPHLVVLLDEAAYGLKINPNFRQAMDTIAAQGRALGVHQILSTQRAADFDPKVRSNIDVRMSLRVASAEDSKTMFNRQEAFTRLQRPGQAYIQVGDNEIFEMFQAARADTPFVPDGIVAVDQLDSFTLYEVLADGRRRTLYAHRASPQAKSQRQGEHRISEAEALVALIDRYSEGRYPPARIICLPPLLEAEELPLMPLLAANSVYCRWLDSGWSAEKDAARRLQVPLGMLDLPARQAQQPLVLDLNERDGNFLVVGPAGSGKSLFLRSLILALAATHTPAEVHFYLVSRGPALTIFEELPHCCAVIRAMESERMMRLFTFLREEVNRRRDLMRQAKVDSMDALRQLRPELSLPAMVLVLEDYAAFRADHEDKLDPLQLLAGDGRIVDVHLILTVNTISVIHTKLQDNLRNRLALGLKSPGDHLDVLGKRAEVLSELAGRGYVVVDQEILECQIAAPARQPGLRSGAPEATHDLQAIIAVMSAAWPGERPRGIEELPKYIQLESLWQKTPGRPSATNELLTAPLGMEYEQQTPQTLDFSRLEQYALIIGPSGSGKSDFLLSLCLAAVKNLSPSRLELIVMALKPGYLRVLRGLPQVQFAGTPTEARRMLATLATVLQQRSAVYRQMLEKSAGDSLEITRVLPRRTVLVIDDLQMLMRDEELPKLVDQCIEAGRDLGLNVILADTSHGLNQAKQKFNVKFVQEACRYECGVVFSAEQTDLAVMNMHFRFKQPELKLHGPSIGRGRGFVVYQGRGLVAQFARFGAAGEDESTRLACLKELIGQLAAQYPAAASP